MPVIVRYWDGRAPPTLHGIETPKSINWDEFLNLARTHLGLDKTISLYLFCENSSRQISSYGASLQKLDDEWASTRSAGGHLIIYCVPNPKGTTAKKGWNGTAHAMVDLTENSRQRAAQEFMASGGSSMQGFEEYTLPVSIIPIEYGNVTGGPRAKKAVAEALVASLRPFRRTPDDAEETALLEREISVQFGSGSNQFADVQAIDRVNALYRSGGSLSRAFQPLKLSAVWSREQVEKSFDLNAWKGFAVDPSAAPEKLAPFEEYYEALKLYKVQSAESKSLPRRICDEIAHKSTEMSLTGHIPNSILHQIEAGGMCRYKLTLTSTSPKNPKEKKGKLRVEVFVWKTGGPRTTAFFPATLDWGSSSSRGRSRFNRSVEYHPLRLTLQQQLAQNAEFSALEAHRKKWAAKDVELSQKRSIPALMEAMERPEAPAATQPRGLTVTMRPYQLQSLKFMMDAEQGDGGFRRHLWCKVNMADGTPFWYSPLLGRVARDVPTQAWGGFCCEEMGLGKTVEILGLCLTNPAPPLPPNSKNADGCLRSRATLVVCAVSLVGQWIAEAQSKTGGSMRIHMYHGTGRIRDSKRLANDFDLVVTTYATLSSDCGNKRGAGGFNPKNTPLHSIQWHRLVLDESHTCKNPAVGHTKACVALKADRRWMCTGTPINTDVQDLYGQFAVLGFAPFNNKSFFDCNVRNAFGNNVFSGGCPELLHALGAIMVRHTKTQELGGEQVLQLPPKTEELIPGNNEVEGESIYYVFFSILYTIDTLLQFNLAYYSIASRIIYSLLSL